MSIKKCKSMHQSSTIRQVESMISLHSSPSSQMNGVLVEASDSGCLGGR